MISCPRFIFAIDHVSCQAPVMMFELDFERKCIHKIPDHMLLFTDTAYTVDSSFTVSLVWLELSVKKYC